MAKPTGNSKWSGLRKRGITPIMATFLLISFAVALGVVIMNVGRAQVEEEAECSIEVGLHFAEIEGMQQICYDSVRKALTFTVENGVNVPVEGLVVNVIGTDRAESYELNDAKMVRAGTFLAHLQFSTPTGGVVRQVKITPKVILVDEEQICVDKALVTETVRDCT